MICKECENDDDFNDGEDGFFYCQQCNTQAEGIIQTENEPIRIPSRNEEDNRKLSYEDYYKETRDRYVKGFLMMITYQCDALIEKFNVTPLIIGLIGPICLRFVSLSGVFDDNWADQAIIASEFRSEDTNGEVIEPELKRMRYKDEPVNIDGKRAVAIWLSVLKKSLPLSSSLAISFLACHKAGSSILPTDIAKWAQEGKIPYLSSFLKIQEKIGVKSIACPLEASKMFRPFQIVSARRLEARAASIADLIGLSLPPVNFYGIASNYLKRLSITEDKVLDLVRLIQNWSMPSELYLSKNELKLSTRVCVMSIVVIAIRMHYNINGFGVWEQSLGLVNGEARYDSKLLDDTEKLLKNLEMKYYDVAAQTREHEKDLLSYLVHGKKEIFAGLEKASADDTYRTVDNLWNGYTPSKRRRDFEDSLLLNQLSLNDDKLKESKTMDCDEPSLECDNQNQEEKSKEREIRRLIRDMRENFFHYIPPRVKVKRLDYLHYARRKEDGAFVYATHADYYILLRVCAKVAEIDVRNMHRGVLSFERKLAWIEKRIDQVLYLTPASMTCEHC